MYQPFYRHYTLPNGEVSEFRQVDRIRLVNKLVGRHVNLMSMKSAGVIKGYVGCTHADCTTVQQVPHSTNLLLL